LASIVEARGFGLFEGKFDCLAVKDGNALLFEVKTLLPSTSDEEKQTVKGVGQLKYYKFAHQQMGHNNIKEFIVFSIRPSVGIIEFCTAENIFVMWRDGQTFRVLNRTTRADDLLTQTISSLKVAHTLPGRTCNPHPKPVNKCAQCSVSGQSSQ
jgi:hypothetical protein